MDFLLFCSLAGPEFWSLVLIRDGVLTQREISSQLSIGPQTLNSAFKRRPKYPAASW